MFGRVNLTGFYETKLVLFIFVKMYILTLNKYVVIILMMLDWVQYSEYWISFNKRLERCFFSVLSVVFLSVLP